MNKPLIIANWKMSLAPNDASLAAKKLSKAFSKFGAASVVICPSFTDIAAVGSALEKSAILLGAQDCFWEDYGPYTGEISIAGLRSYGVSHIIIGHSERREHLHETDAMVNKKMLAALAADMVPILCIGETFEERRTNQKEHILQRELMNAMHATWLTKANQLIVAYEPIWMIGSGQDINDDEIEHTHRVIKQTLYDLLPDTVVDTQIAIIYGGSVNPENVRALVSQPSVDGVLVGGASTDPIVFSSLIHAAAK